MIIRGDDTIRGVSWISHEEERRIMDFLQGAVYCFCNNHRDEWFSAIELMGGLNRDNWTNTPLGVLYDKHINDGKDHEEAWALAGQEEGKILKKVIQNDQRQFETEESFPARKYRWIL